MGPKIIEITDLGPSHPFDMPTLHDYGVGLAHSLFLSYGSAPFLWVIVTGNNKMLTVETPWESEDEKARSSAMMRAYMRLLGAKAYTFITEAWMARVDAKAEPDFEKIPPRERSNREDVLAVSTFDSDGEGLLTRYRVSYPGEGQKPTLSVRDDIDLDTANAGGRIWNLLHDHD